LSNSSSSPSSHLSTNYHPLFSFFFFFFLLLLPFFFYFFGRRWRWRFRVRVGLALHGTRRQRDLDGFG